MNRFKYSKLCTNFLCGLIQRHKSVSSAYFETFFFTERVVDLVRWSLAFDNRALAQEFLTRAEASQHLAVCMQRELVKARALLSN
jgi:uncharacterized protein with PhoU and TrkA domain